MRLIMGAAEFINIGKSPKICFIIFTLLAWRRCLVEKTKLLSNIYTWLRRRTRGLSNPGWPNLQINLAVDIIPVKRID
jgi:hypothetical protein